MPIIPTVGRKALRIRLLIAGLYVVLSLGAVTMVYPFLLMLSTSITSSTDMNEYRIVPRYLNEDRPLFAKFVDDKYAGDIKTVNALYGADLLKSEEALPDARARSAEGKRLAAAWDDFFAQLPREYKQAGFRGYGSHPSQLAIAYRAHVRELFQGDIDALNRKYTEENDTFATVSPPIERSLSRNWSPDDSPKVRDFIAWTERLTPRWMIPVGVDPIFTTYLRETVTTYGGDLGKIRAVWGARMAGAQVSLPSEPPADAAQRADWEPFVRTVLPLRYVRVLPAGLPLYQAALARKYGDVARLNHAHGTHYPGFGAVVFPGRLPATGPVLVDWGEFVARSAPLSCLRVDSPENRFRSYLGAHGLDPRLATHAPVFAADSAYVLSNAATLRRDYAGRNYRLVLDYILLHGRALWVTAIFCLAVIATTLLVNPMCAYALSRYALPYAHKVLLFLLATMAFPAEVAMIPNFLLLKQLGMLNTYWALILPGMASGFSIFLLKGFFDSLPRELYEAATIDGASEGRMFFRITLPLSKPIFAVIALQAFTAAYGAFMFALLVCQNPRMWTVMVWLYELQINNPQYIMMAALTVAALPTLLVFLCAQNVIMRGIILPSYK